MSSIVIYRRPNVSAIDDDAAQSQPADAKLGISGWERTILNETLDDYLISVHPELIEVDPKTGRKVLVASATIVEIHGEHRAGGRMVGRSGRYDRLARER